MNEFVLNGLVKRRAELAGDIENTHEVLRKMVLDLESLDAMILQFDPIYLVKSIKAKAFRPPNDQARRSRPARPAGKRPYPVRSGAGAVHVVGGNKVMLVSHSG